MSEVIKDLIQLVNCTNDKCQAYINGSDIVDQCTINGQLQVNGVCQCTTKNSIVQGNSCVCPQYSTSVNSVCTCNVIAGQIMVDEACVCSTSGAFVSSGLCTCGVDGLNISNTCKCPDNSTLINGICICDIIGQSIISGVCTCKIDEQPVNGVCEPVIVINGSDSSLSCSQVVYVSIFDIQNSTQIVSSSSDFSSGYVFSSTSIIQNAFIDVLDNVYSTFSPLFQNQCTFTNIKIQIGTQTLGSGSLLTTNIGINQLLINQMNIISRADSQLTIQTQLNILTSLTQSTNINNLLVNLSCIQSQKIFLIYNISGFTNNIIGYHILGTYQSTSIVAMVAYIINSAAISINKVNFNPIVYNVGNCSSYLVSNITSSVFTITSVAIRFGQNTNYQITSSISSSNTAFYQFGGIVNNVVGSSSIKINTMIVDCYQQFTSGYVNKSGLIVGLSASALSSVSIINLCDMQKITSTTIQFTNFGLIGMNYGNTSVQQITITLTLQGEKIIYFGLIGYQLTGSLYSEIASTRAQVILISNAGDRNGALFGSLITKNCSILNTSVINASMSSKTNVGGFMGAASGNLSIFNSSILQSNILGSDNVAGFIAYTNNTKHFVTNSKIELNRITASSRFGLIIGYAQGTNTYTFVNSSSNSNYINGALQVDCASMTKNSITGC
ncbi:Conserved_hypothetical protein [Hexamita inflata]|uniref:Uncharacterized protein n=1 Tax=Hexamita inflata TaxID=28002 RepID=A0AA86TG65_9EUKA|nr:Conserved hypothetical protein [Hexamita inflata]